MSSKRKLENMLNVLRNYIRQETLEPIKSIFGKSCFCWVEGVLCIYNRKYKYAF